MTTNTQPPLAQRAAEALTVWNTAETRAQATREERERRMLLDLGTETAVHLLGVHPNEVRTEVKTNGGGHQRAVVEVEGLRFALMPRGADGDRPTLQLLQPCAGCKADVPCGNAFRYPHLASNGARAGGLVDLGAALIVARGRVCCNDCYERSHA